MTSKYYAFAMINNILFDLLQSIICLFKYVIYILIHINFFDEYLAKFEKFAENLKSFVSKLLHQIAYLAHGIGK